MRPNSGFNSTTASVPHSQWHSPVPYLFGGLAAMLGLIAFALLILACSYWRLSGFLGSADNGERDVESNEEKSGDSVKVLPILEEKIVVIMAGDVKPTFLATPSSSRASSFGDKSYKESQKQETQLPETEKQPSQD